MTNVGICAGMNMDQVMAVTAAALDEIIEDNQEKYRIDMQDISTHPDDIEEILESQRVELAAWRRKALVEMRCFLERDKTMCKQAAERDSATKSQLLEILRDHHGRSDQGNGGSEQ